MVRLGKTAKHHIGRLSQRGLRFPMESNPVSKIRQATFESDTNRAFLAFEEMYEEVCKGYSEVIGPYVAERDYWVGKVVRKMAEDEKCPLDNFWLVVGIQAGPALSQCVGKLEPSLSWRLADPLFRICEHLERGQELEFSDVIYLHDLRPVLGELLALVVDNGRFAEGCVSFRAKLAFSDTAISTRLTSKDFTATTPDEVLKVFMGVLSNMEFE